MRFAELHLVKYGHFDGCDLHFSKGATSDFQIIYGPNEAGKSTALEAASDFLFGFPHTTKYDFRFDKQLLRIGAVVENNGTRLSLRRRKGNAGTLLSDDDKPVSDMLLTDFLKGQTVETFHRMFGLDHTRLRDGGQAILDAKDDVGQAIFAAGSGLTGVTQLLEQLDEQAKAIWVPRMAATRSYYVALKRFDDSRAELKTALLKPARWDELRKLIQETNATIAERRAQRVTLEGTRQKLERRRRILPSAAKRSMLEDSITQFAAIPQFPADASARLAAIDEAIDTATADKRAAADRAKATSDELSTLIVDDLLLSRVSDIETLKGQRSAIADYVQDLPKRVTQRDGLATRIVELLAELEWPSDVPSVLREKMPGTVRIAEVRDLLERLGAAEAVVLKSSEDSDERTREMEDLDRTRSTLRAGADTTILAAAVRFALSKGDTDATVQTRAASLERATAERERALLRLSPWSGTIASLRTLVLPSALRAGELVSKISQAAAGLVRDKDSLEAELGRRGQLILEQTQAVRDDRAIAPETLLEARQDRDESWAPLRAHALGQRSLEQPEVQTQDFETRVRRADELADQRFAAAEQSGRLVALAEEVERLELSIAAGEKNVAAAAAMIDALEAEWSSEIAVLGMQLSPGDFIAWSERRDVALDADERVDEAGASVRGARAEREAARKSLFDAFETGAWAVDRELTTGMLIELADARITAEAEARRAEEAHRQSSEAAGANLSRAQSKHRIAQDELTAIVDQWKPALKGLRFGDTSSPAVVRARLNLLEELRRSVDEVLTLEHRIQTMDANITSFSDQVHKLALECGHADSSATAPELLNALGAAVAKAADAAQKRDGLTKRVSEETNKEDAADRTLALAKEKLAPLLMIGEVGDIEALRILLADADQRAAQQRALSSLDLEIVSLGDGHSLTTLLDDAKNADPEGLKAESDAVELQLADLNEQIEGLMATLAATRKDFENLNTGSDAAIAASEMAFAKSEMEAQAELYVRLRAEAVLLKWAIEKYRREKQAPLLLRASALFSTLTLGAYSTLMVDNEASRPRLCGLPTGATRLTPVNGMSEGTVDQLYLALRLAAVEDAVANGVTLPFLADDLFINYDDERAAAGFRVLSELSTKTQVLFFTHHKHLVELAQTAAPSIEASMCRLGA